MATKSLRQIALRYTVILANLVAGVNASAQSFALTGSLHTARASHTATLLANGQVLAAGGDGAAGILSSAELYNPATGTWTVTGSMNIPREDHAATLLENGEVLVVGGITNSTNTPTATAELYNPGTGKWTLTGSLPVATYGFGLALLPNGNVLVAGGSIMTSSGCCQATNAAEIYNPSTGAWAVTGSLNEPRVTAATLLTDGKVLMAGGGTNERTAEIYSNGVWTLTSEMVNAHGGMREAPLNTGNALVYGGTNLASYAGEYYDPATNVWMSTHNLGVTPVNGPLTALANGDVLLSGGINSYHNINPNGYVYVPSTNSWGAGARMNVARTAHAAVALQNGDVLVLGGINTSSGLLASAEIFTP